MAAQQTYLTREGYRELERELDYLSTVRREQIARLLHEALEEGGDLLENGVLESVRNEQAFVEGRIQELRTILNSATVIDESALPRDRAALGSYVTIMEMGGDNTPETYRIVGPFEADPLDGKVSHESPLGRALLGHKAGDSIVVNAPAGKKLFRILRISGPGDRDGKAIMEQVASLDRVCCFSDDADGRKLPSRAVAGSPAG